MTALLDTIRPANGIVIFVSEAYVWPITEILTNADTVNEEGSAT
jgi:hypothetical protein